MIPIRDASRIPGHRSRTTLAVVVVTVASHIAAGRLAPQGWHGWAVTGGVVPALWSGPVSGDVVSDLMLVGTAVSSLLIHGSVLHLGVNMLYLWVFGDDVEAGLGWVGFLFLYLAAGLAGAVAHSLSVPTSTAPAVGASGAVAGVLGAYAVLRPRVRVLTLIPAPSLIGVANLPGILFAMVWLSVQALGAWAGGVGVSWWGHLGGFTAGVAVGAGRRWRRT